MGDETVLRSLCLGLLGPILLPASLDARDKEYEVCRAFWNARADASSEEIERLGASLRAFGMPFRNGDKIETGSSHKAVGFDSVREYQQEVTLRFEQTPGNPVVLHLCIAKKTSFTTREGTVTNEDRWAMAIPDPPLDKAIVIPTGLAEGVQQGWVFRVVEVVAKDANARRAPRQRDE